MTPIEGDEIDRVPHRARRVPEPCADRQAARDSAERFISRCRSADSTEPQVIAQAIDILRDIADRRSGKSGNFIGIFCRFYCRITMERLSCFQEIPNTDGYLLLVRNIDRQRRARSPVFSTCSASVHCLKQHRVAFFGSGACMRREDLNS
jgi:hypothetical protein